MARKKDIEIDFDLSPDLIRWCTRTAPQQLKVARRNAVESMGMIWADESKSITREGNHIDTGLYVNSIGYSTDIPSNPLYELTESQDRAELDIGADISYASHLEKRYNIFVRGLDRAQPRMKRVAEIQVQKAFR